MTAETGTYRWMAPEVIAHQYYDEKADVFSYGVMVWELVSGGEVPYPGYTPLQAAVGIVQRGLRPTISPSVHPVIAQVMQYCWNVDPAARPSMEQIITLLRNIDVPRQQEGKHGFLDRLRSVSFKSKKSTRSQ
jgi:serine/threonine protein kinase